MEVWNEGRTEEEPSLILNVSHYFSVGNNSQTVSHTPPETFLKKTPPPRVPF
jgi:hypothetical protein